jgi:hypothetical protein
LGNKPRKKLAKKPEAIKLDEHTQGFLDALARIDARKKEEKNGKN